MICQTPYIYTTCNLEQSLTTLELPTLHVVNPPQISEDNFGANLSYDITTNKLTNDHYYYMIS